MAKLLLGTGPFLPAPRSGLAQGIEFLTDVFRCRLQVIQQHLNLFAEYFTIGYWAVEILPVSDTLKSSAGAAAA